MTPTTEIVDTPAEAAELERAPLIVRQPLSAYLDGQGLGSGEIRAERIGEGHSNITYLIDRDGARFVLRRPPRPPLPPSAHDVLREARLLSAVEEADVRTPRVLATCDDESVLGVPFYVMEYVEGSVITGELPDRTRRAGGAPAHRRGARRFALRDPRRRLARLRPRGLRQANRLHRAPAAPLQRPLGAQQDA